MAYHTRLLPLLLLAACGVPDGKLFAELDDDKVASVCEPYQDRAVSCGDDAEGWSVEVGCEAFDVGETCYVTVGDYRLCQEAVEQLTDDQICEAGGLPAACDALLSEDCLPL